MRIAILNTKDTLRARYLLECFMAGAKKHGDSPYWVSNPDTYRRALEAADVGVAMCYANKHHAGSKQGKFRIGVAAYMRKRGRRILFIDTGFIRNQTDYEAADQARNPTKNYALFDIDNKATYERVLKDIYYEVGFDGLKRHADYCTDGRDPSRWRRLQSEGVVPAPWRTEGKHILLIGQTMNGLSTQHLKGNGIFDWYAHVVKVLRKHTDRPILYRVHPRLTKIRADQDRIRTDEKHWQKFVGTVPNLHKSTGWFVEDDLKNAWAAVAFTSNASVRAILNGIPVFACDPGCMAWDVSNHDLALIEKPKMPDRSNWFNRIAFSQFTCQDLIDGACWGHFRPHALKPPKPPSVLDVRY